MYSRSFAILLLFFTSTLSFAQTPPAIQWAKCFGGTLDDWAWSIYPTRNNGYIISGTTGSTDGDVTGNHGAGDAWLVKTNNTGSIQWQKCFGSTLGIEEARSIKQTFDGGYIFAGITDWDGDDVSGLHGFGQFDFWVVKTDSVGNIQWQKCLGGSSWELSHDIIVTRDSGYIIAGYAESVDGDVTGNHGYDCWITKLDTGGTLQWQKCLGGFNDDEAYSILEIADGYVFAGSEGGNGGDVSGSHGGSEDIWLVKLNNLGALQWQKCLGGSGDDSGIGVVATNDGGYFVGGATSSTDGNVTNQHGNGDFWLIKVDSSGTMLWQKCFGGYFSDWPNSMQSTSDGGIIMAGATASNDTFVPGNHGLTDFWVIKIDSSGNLQWGKNMGGSGWDEAFSVQQTSDDGFIVAGITESNDSDVTGNHGGKDFWVVKLSAAPLQVSEASFTNANLNAYLNHSTGKLILEFHSSISDNERVNLFDVTGRVILQEKIKITSGGNHFETNISNLSKGIYLVQLLGDTYSEVKKIVLN